MTDVDVSRGSDPVVATAPDGRRMLRIEARNAEVPIERKPPWIKTTLRTGPAGEGAGSGNGNCARPSAAAVACSRSW